MNNSLYTLTLLGLFYLLNTLEYSNSFQETKFQETKASFITKDSLPICAQKALQKKWLDIDPTFPQKQNTEELLRYERLKNPTTTARRRMGYELPVVVHIIHNNGAENISDAAVIKSIQFLNDGFSNSGTYAGTDGTDTEIQFKLADRAPNGSPSNGINRLQSSLTDITFAQDVALKNLIRWDPNCYVNVWLVKEICASATGCGVAGYAYLPTSHGSEIDGIVMEARFIGTNREDAVVLNHEMGHYLGLYHTFEGGCKNDDCLLDGDRVCDTPPDQSTVRANCSNGANSCFTDVNLGDSNNPFTVDQNDQMENFMDYASCSVLFTEGQKLRMTDVLENERYSLIDPEGCNKNCSNIVTANFSASETDILVGKTVTFTDNSIGGLIKTWNIDGVPFTSNSFTFNEVGTFEITLEIIGADANCTDLFSLNIKVSCQVRADFNVDQTKVKINENAIFTNQSIDANSFEWSVNGTVESTDRDFNFSSPDNGIYSICLTAKNAFCESKRCIRVLVGSGGSGPPCTGPNCEDCNNGIDDDDDGLVDFYDDDCPCNPSNDCGSPFFSRCQSECQTPEILDQIVMRRTMTPIPTFWGGFMSVGDVDGDCNPDFIVKKDLNEIIVADENSIKGIYIEPNNTIQLHTIGDTDHDGMAEIFVITKIPRQNRLHLSRFDWNPAIGNLEKTWQSPQMIRLDHPMVGTVPAPPFLADFNQDGRSEIYIGHQIYDTETGTELVFGDSNMNTGAIRQFVVASKNYNSAIAVDLLPDEACDDCEGLELAAGNQILSVNIQSYTDPSQNSIKIVRELPGFFDGPTAVADFDLDGDADIIVTNREGTTELGLLYIWDGQTPTLVGQPTDFELTDHSFITTALVPTIGDVDGDARPEIILNHSTILIFEDYQTGGGANWGQNSSQVIRASLPADDHATTITLFDFNFDGKQEILVRNFAYFRILNEDLQTIGEDPDVTTGSGLEQPIIVDIDNDNEAEIVTFGCLRSISGSNTSRCNQIMIFDSANKPWPNTRKIYNQVSYFNTNINDDGTIPIQQQSPHLVTSTLNSFNQQHAFPKELDCIDEICDNGIDDDGDGLIDENDLECPCSKPEAAIIIAGATCENSGLVVEFEICNEGTSLLPASYPIAIYGGNPTRFNVPLHSTFELPSELLEGECVTIKKNLVSIIDSVFIVVNDDGTLPRPFNLNDQFPPTALEECNYLNNISGIKIPVNNSTPLDLGPDQIVCDNGIFELNAGTSFETYRWFDGSMEQTLTVYEAGRYWVETIDICGFIQRDTIVIEIDPITEVKLGDDLVVCEGDTIQFDAGNFDNYKWLPKPVTNCDSCQVFSLKVLQDTQVIVYVSSDLGCFSSDTIDIKIEINPIGLDSIFLCQGDTILINGTNVSSDTLLTQKLISFKGCDSLVNTKIVFNDSTLIKEKIEICEGDTAFVFGNMITQNDTFFQIFNQANGCDSTHLVEVFFNQKIETFEQLEFCEGDTAFVFGNTIVQDDTVSQIFTSANGCDSTHNMDIVFLEEAEKMIFESLCENEILLFFNDTISETGTYFQTVASINACDTNYVLTAEFFEEPTFTIITDTLLRFGESIQIPLNIPDSTFQVIWKSNPQLSCENCLNPTVNIIETTTFEATITNSQGCSAIAQIIIRVADESGVFIPSVFSPNNDAINDIFTVFSKEPKQIDQLQIFDRWGGLLFELNEFMSNDPASGWDGTSKNRPVNTGVYVYKILIKNYTGKQEVFAGDITVIR